MTGRRIADLYELLMTDTVGRYGGAAFFSLWILMRIYRYHDTFLQWLVTFQFVLFVAAYLSRHRATVQARGFREVVYPFICSGFPFLIDSYPFMPCRDLSTLHPLSMTLMFTGTSFIIAGIAFLRRSFSIMTEVREPVFRGIYRWTRHPMYLGSILSSLGITLCCFSPLTAFLFTAFVIMQVLRARFEEDKITAAFPGYGNYALRVGWFWKLGRHS